MAPSNWVPPEPVIGMLFNSPTVSMRYCGICTTIGYDTPFFGFSQNVGAVCMLPARLSCMLVAKSRSVSPTSLAKDRLTFTFRVGALNACWIRGSAIPGTSWMRFSSILA